MFEPDEKSLLSSPAFEVAFQLQYVIAPEDVNILFHHEQLVREGKCLAWLVFNRHTEPMQQSFLFKKPLYQPGEIMDIGVFENASSSPVMVRAGIIGTCEDCRVDLSGGEHAAVMP